MKIKAALMLALVGALIAASAARAQENRPTLNKSATIAAGNTFQTILPAASPWSLTIQNNNTNSDNCWIFIGSGTASKGASILLGPGGSYGRYYPYVPSDVIQGTCATTSDTLYVDTQ